jgi:lipopolysaccharide heptosyltransferase II
MKLCLIFSHYPPSRQIGGIEDYSRILVNQFRKMGVNTSVITSGGYQGADEKVFKVGNSEWGYEALKTIIRIIHENKFDIVLLQYTPDAYGFGLSFKFLPLCLRFIKKKPFFITTFHTLVGGHWISKIHAFLLTLFSHKVISTNEDLTCLFKRYLGVYSFKLEEIPIGSNIHRIHHDRAKARENLARETNIQQNTVWLVNFGFAIPNKGIEELFQALAALIEKGKKYTLFMVSPERKGNEEYRTHLINLSKNLKIDNHVIWITESSQEDVSRILEASDIYVVPYKDGICTRRGTLMAGIVHHLPIISTHPHVPTPYFKNEENVLLVEPKNPAQLAKAIERLSHDEKLKKKLSLNIAKIEKYFDWNQIAHNTISLYGKSSKTVIERVRYPFKILFESLEYLFLLPFLKKAKERIRQDISLKEKTTDTTQIKAVKILIVQLNSIGDVMMSTALFRSLKNAFAQTQIDILCLPHTAALLERNPHINKIYCLKKNFWRDLLFRPKAFHQSRQLLKRLRNEEYDLCVDLMGTFESVFLTSYFKDIWTVGFEREIKRGLFYQKTSDHYSDSFVPLEKHIMDNQLLIGQKLGGQDNDRNEELGIQQEERDFINDFQKEKGIEGLFVVIHPGAKWSPKRWPKRDFALLIDMLKQECNRQTVLVGGTSDKRLLKEIYEATCFKPIVCCENLNLRCLGELIRRSGLFIGNDSGISHIAAAVGSRTLVLFGPTDPATCLARGPHVVAMKTHAFCWPCTLYYRRHQCQMGDNICMQSIKPKAVFEKVKSLCA